MSWKAANRNNSARRDDRGSFRSDNCSQLCKRSLPGYYYDAAKKKYFKINKDHPPPAPSSASGTLPSMDPVSKIAVGTRHKFAVCTNVCELTYRRAASKLSPHFFSDSIRNCFVDGLSASSGLRRSAAVFADLSVHGQDPDYMCNMRASFCGGYLAILTKFQGCQEEVFRVFPVNTVHDRLVLATPLPFSYLNLFLLGAKIVSWSPHVELSDKLLVGVSDLSSRRGLSAVVLLCTDNVDSELGLVSLPAQISCLSWNCNSLRRSMFAVSFDCGIQFTDVERLCSPSSIVRTHSFPQSLAFAKSSDTVVVGCKSGHVQVVDIRERKPVGRLQAASEYCIDCLKLLNDENMLIVSNWQGDITLLDLRFRGALMSYFGHRNNHGKLEFCLDRMQKNIFAVGSDRCLRVWDVRLGRLVSTMAGRNPSIRGCGGIPAIEYVDTFARSADISGLLYADEAKLELFPLSSL